MLHGTYFVPDQLTDQLGRSWAVTGVGGSRITLEVPDSLGPGAAHQVLKLGPPESCLDESTAGSRRCPGTSSMFPDRPSTLTSQALRTRPFVPLVLIDGGRWTQAVQASFPALLGSPCWTVVGLASGGVIGWAFH